MSALPIQQVPVRVNGVDLAIAVATTGPAIHGKDTPLVWIHGLGAASTITFAGVSEHPMLHHPPTLLIDLPGSGASLAPAAWPGTIEGMADAVLAILSSLVQQPVALFGHSMGGSVAIVAAHRRPDLVRQLIVAEPNLDPGVGTTSVTIARQTEAGFVESGFTRLIAATERLARQGNTAAATWVHTLRQADPVALHRSATSLVAERSPTFRDLLLDMPMPVATIWGEHSPLPEPPLPSRPNLRGYVASGAGHQMFDDNPDEFAATLARILSDMA